MRIHEIKLYFISLIQQWRILRILPFSLCSYYDQPTHFPFNVQFVFSSLLSRVIIYFSYLKSLERWRKLDLCKWKCCLYPFLLCLFKMWKNTLFLGENLKIFFYFICFMGIIDWQFINKHFRFGKILLSILHWFFALIENRLDIALHLQGLFFLTIFGHYELLLDTFSTTFPYLENLLLPIMFKVNLVLLVLN